MPIFIGPNGDNSPEAYERTQIEKHALMELQEKKQRPGVLLSESEEKKLAELEKKYPNMVQKDPLSTTPKNNNNPGNIYSAAKMQSVFNDPKIKQAFSGLSILQNKQ